LNSDEALLGNGGIAAIAFYLLALLGLGWMGRRAREEQSMADFYLGGRSLGFVVLVMTLYATQYSGNTLIGFAGKAYREGFTFLVAVTFMIGVVAVQFLFAPRLHRLSHEQGFITPSDFIMHRFGSRPFAILISISGIFALLNYVLTNLKGIGYAVETVTGGKISFAYGVVFLSVIILVYETLGGLRSVAWTDVLQGVILLFGCLIIFTVILVAYEGTTGVFLTLKEQRPEFWRPLTGKDLRWWFSTLIVVSGGIAIYPHAVQRIFAAKNSQTLKRAYVVMLFMPIATTLLMVFVGWVGAAQIPGLDKAGSESITLRMLGELAQKYPALQVVIVLFVAAVFAAIMSTVDSALLSISSMITQDLCRPKYPGLSEAQLTSIGKYVSWVLMVLMVWAAIAMDKTIWWFIQIKVELLVQGLPAILLGLYWKGLRTSPTMWGFVVGTLVVVFFSYGSTLSDGISARPFDMHGGLTALLVNVFITIGGSLLSSEKTAGKES
jgi:solute:Na+ symporter, SSS family